MGATTHTEINTDKVYDAVILGAGAAGIKAAETLMEGGCDNLLVVEGRDRIGGRTYTDERFFDLGAMWLHTNDPRLSTLRAANLLDLERTMLTHARENGYTLHLDAQDNTLYHNGKHYTRAEYLQRWEEAFSELERIIAAHGDMSAADALAHMEKKDPFMEFILRMEFGWGTSGWDFEQTSVAAWTKQNSVASGLITDKGLGTLIADMGQKILPYTALETRVKGIFTQTQKPYNEIDVIDKDGTHKTIKARTVLSTIPPAVFNHKGDDSEIAHDFPDEKVAAMQALPSGAMNKIIMEVDEGYFDRIHMPDNKHFEIWVEGLGNVFFIARPGGKNLLVALVGGQRSIELERGTDAQAVDFAKQFLATTPDFPDLDAHITGAHLTRWHQDPFARGSYSNPQIGKSDLRAALAEPIGDRVFFAGEACATSGWATHLFGAVETGSQAAQAMLKTIHKTRGTIDKVLQMPPATDTPDAPISIAS